MLFSPLCRVTAKYKHASCMHVGEAASRDKKNNVKVEIWKIMQKPNLFSENNWNQCECCSWCIYSTFLLQLKAIWTQTDSLGVKSTHFLRAFRAFSRPFPILTSMLETWRYMRHSCLAGHLWQWGENLCFGIMGTWLQFSRDKGCCAVVWFTQCDWSLTICTSGSLLSQVAQCLWWRGFPVPHTWQMTLPF